MKRKKFIKLTADNYEGSIMTPRAYNYCTLEMSSGDFGSHIKEVVFLTEKEVNSLNDQELILWDLSEKEALKQYFQEVKDGVSADLSFKDFIELTTSNGTYVYLGRNLWEM